MTLDIGAIANRLLAELEGSRSTIEGQKLGVLALHQAIAEAIQADNEAEAKAAEELAAKAKAALAAKANAFLEACEERA